ncbi:MAG TPA: prepilin-type N-terminal cleavage/methylation domain-containing protein [Candidatus Marinimicrobia bacterium]|nr:prepilin-type N-terminal cleavage/methylation domain-containing protein [Candidatus Neomarinimicrobiota bacterium]
MIRLKITKRQSGLTLVELMTTIVVSGIMMLGLGLSLRVMMFHYQNDSVLQDVRQYGNTVMREIMKEISLSRFIDFSPINNFERIFLTKYDEYGNSTKTTITANAIDGVLFNYKLPLNGALALPKKGRFRNNNQRNISLREFDAWESKVISTRLQRFAQSTITLRLELEVETINAPGGKQVEIIRFERKIFMPNKYISLASSTGSMRPTS